MRLLTGPLCRLGAADLDGLAAWARFLQRRDGARAATRPRLHPTAAVRPPPRQPCQSRRPRRPRRRRRCATRRSTVPTARASSRRWTSCRRPAGRRPRASTCRPWRDSACSACARPYAACGRSPACPWPTSSARPSAPWASTSRCWHDPSTPPPPPGRTSTRSPTSRPRSPSAPTGPRSGASCPGCDAAQAEERGLDKGTIEASTDAVQVLTVHAAKGLEWDVVAVPGLVEGVLPRPVERRHVVQGRAVADEPADRQGLVRRPVRRALRPARRPRRAAGPRLAARPRPQGAGGRDQPVRQRRGRARHRGGAPAGLRRLHPGPFRADAHRPGVGRRLDPEADVPLPDRAAGPRASSTWSPSRSSRCPSPTTAARRPTPGRPNRSRGSGRSTTSPAAAPPSARRWRRSWRG